MKLRVVGIAVATLFFVFMIAAFTNPPLFTIDKLIFQLKNSIRYKM